MTTAIILAVVVAVVVVLVAVLLTRRSRTGGAGAAAAPDPASTRVTKMTPPAADEDTGPDTEGGPRRGGPPSRARSKADLSDDEIASVLHEAEAILKAHADEDGEAAPGAAGGEPTAGDDGTAPTTVAEDVTLEELAVEEPAVDEGTGTAVLPARPSFRDRLSRTRQAFSGRLAEIRLRRKIDDDVWDELEETLILADVGAEVAAGLVEAARARAAEEKATTADDVVDALKSVMRERLVGSDRALSRNGDGPSIWFVVGVNGTGKTTTIGKIAAMYAGEGDQVVLAAADTFRAAAADQLQIWADRSGSELVRGQEGGDPGAVVFDAVSLSRSRARDLLLVDTAGRLHTKVNLMDELRKIRRTAEKAGGVPDEVLLVLDATTGQNGLQQAREFAAAAGVTGVVLTKLDGTAKGGIAFAIEQEFDIPIKLVGLGEQAEDLVPFDPDEFVDALFADTP
jgi:fused signal recognition particle receptor